jgi:hypothetical protein
MPNIHVERADLTLTPNEVDDFISGMKKAGWTVDQNGDTTVLTDPDGQTLTIVKNTVPDDPGDHAET